MILSIKILIKKLVLLGEKRTMLIQLVTLKIPTVQLTWLQEAAGNRSEHRVVQLLSPAIHYCQEKEN